jgi:hypothetical protein
MAKRSLLSERPSYLTSADVEFIRRVCNVKEFGQVLAR